MFPLVRLLIYPVHNELQANSFNSGIIANNVPGAPFRNNQQKTIVYKFFIISRRYIFVRCEKNRT